MARGQARSSGVDAPPSPGGVPRGLVLVEPLGQKTWRALADGEIPVAARWLAAASPSPGHASDAATLTWPVWADDPTRDLFPRLGPTLVPVLGLARTDTARWLMSELDDGVPLRRLLALARLTPLQAAAVLDEARAGLVALHDHGRWHGRVHAANVHVGPGGLVRVSDWGPAWLTATALDGHRVADLAALSRLAGELVVSAGAPRHRPASRQAELYGDLARRAETSRLDPGQPLPVLLDADERTRAAAELATVVQALRRSRRPPAPAAQQPPVAAPRTPAVPLVSAGPPVLRRARRRRPSPLVVGLAVSAVLAAAVAAEVVLLGPDIRSSWHRLTDAPADTSRDPRTVVAGAAAPRLAPAASGAVTRVVARPLAACRPGAVCDLRVLVQVWPDDTTRIPVAWTVEVVDTCTGVRTSHPGGAARVPLGADRVDGLTRVLLPDAPDLAVVVVTHQPAEAASAPLLVPAGAGSC